MNFSDSYLLTLISVLFFVTLAAIYFLGDKFIKLKAKEIGVDEKAVKSIFPDFASMLGATPNKVISLKKGYNINLKGKATNKIIQSIGTTRYAIRPIDYVGLSPIPQLEVEVGSTVKAGDVIFFDKVNPAIKYVSPVSGEVIEILRGPKRRIDEIIVLADKQTSFKSNSVPVIASDFESLKNTLLENGLWSLFIQRPFGVIPSIDEAPRDIFVSTFDSAPLAVDSNIAIAKDLNAFIKGVEVLSKLSAGKVYLGLSKNSTFQLGDLPTNVITNTFAGPHPVGNVGIQIHNVSPIKKGDTVWTIDYQNLIILGRFFQTGNFDARKLITIAGPQVNKPETIEVTIGANIGELLTNRLVEGKNRIIAGDVLTGRKTENSDFLGVFEDQISVLKEGDNYELLGWLLPLSPRPSISNTFPNFLYPNMELEPDTNTHGEKRAFVVTGEYEKVLPMDIYPQHLLKSIITNDIEKVEGLGIYEVLPEDLALCEFVCTSKQDVQNILKNGIEMMIEQG